MRNPLLLKEGQQPTGLGLGCRQSLSEDEAYEQLRTMISIPTLDEYLSAVSIDDPDTDGAS
jgi:hypothetical protein